MSNPNLSQSHLEPLLKGKNLSRQDSQNMMTAIMKGQVPTDLLADILLALKNKVETVDEITGMAMAMRENSLSVQPKQQNLVDTCGTGGDGSGTFNISTAAAIVAASMGCFVAKHGNRAVSSKCGSADVLEALGADISLNPKQAALMVDNVGLGFLFAPNLHPAMKHAMPARHKLGVRTVSTSWGL